MRVVLFVVLVALVFAPDASAKCCVLVTPLAPRDLVAGEQWTATVRLDGGADYWRSEGPLKLIAWSDTTMKTISVAMTPSGRTGIYRARVSFPDAGAWSYAVVLEGFRGGSAWGQDHTVNVASPHRWSQSLGTWPLVSAALIGLCLTAACIRWRSAGVAPRSSPT